MWACVLLQNYAFALQGHNDVFANAVALGLVNGNY